MSDSTGRLEELRERLGNAPDEARNAVATGSESELVARSTFANSPGVRPATPC